MNNKVTIPSNYFLNYDNIIETLNMNGKVFVTRDGKEEAVMIKIEDFAAHEEFFNNQYICRELEKAEVRLEADRAVGKFPEK